MFQEIRENDRVCTEAATTAAYEAGLAEGIVEMSVRRAEANLKQNNLSFNLWPCVLSISFS